MAAREEARRRENSYSPDLSRTVMVDLRRFANSSFTDDKAGDGEGGWTDEGRQNCLENVPRGVQTLRGVPCELIRFDRSLSMTTMGRNPFSLSNMRFEVFITVYR